MPGYIEGMTMTPPTAGLRVAADIDAGIAESARCPRCARPLTYEGWFDRKGGSYRAFMVCICGYEKEF